MAQRKPREPSESQLEAIEAFGRILGSRGAKATFTHGPEWDSERREYTTRRFIRCGAVTIYIAPDGRLTTEVR